MPDTAKIQTKLLVRRQIHGKTSYRQPSSTNSSSVDMLSFFVSTRSTTIIWSVTLVQWFSSFSAMVMLPTRTWARDPPSTSELSSAVTKLCHSPIEPLMLTTMPCASIILLKSYQGNTRQAEKYIMAYKDMVLSMQCYVFDTISMGSNTPTRSMNYIYSTLLTS